MTLDATSDHAVKGFRSSLRTQTVFVSLFAKRRSATRHRFRSRHAVASTKASRNALKLRDRLRVGLM